MTADDLTRLRAEIWDQLRTEFAEILVTHRYVYGQWDGATICRCGQPADRVPPRNASADHRAHVASVLASSPTVAALIDRVERAERERDLLQTEVNTWIENDQISFARATRLDDEITALRAAVEGKADEWEERAMTCCSLTCKNCGARYIDPDELRGLLTEGADDGQ